MLQHRLDKILSQYKIVLQQEAGRWLGGRWARRAGARRAGRARSSQAGVRGRAAADWGARGAQAAAARGRGAQRACGHGRRAERAGQGWLGGRRAAWARGLARTVHSVLST